MSSRTSGIRTLADLKGRCRIDDETGCWRWAAGADGSGRPSLWLPALGRRVTLGIAICVLRTGNAPAPGVSWHCTCATPNCANPAHRVAGNRSSQMRAAKLTRDAVTRARIAACKRAKSKLPDEAADDIRRSSEPLRVVAERHGISISHASNIRRCEMRLPLAARGASVFNLGS
jgi:hypothetical protein